MQGHATLEAQLTLEQGLGVQPPPIHKLFVVGKPFPQPRRLLPGTINKMPLPQTWPPGPSACCNCHCH